MFITIEYVQSQFESGGHKTVSKEMGRPPGTNG
jgi:hypothetical protein